MNIFNWGALLRYKFIINLSVYFFMIKFNFDIYTVEDIMGEEYIEKYHKAWTEWNERNNEKESHEIVQCARDDRVVIGKLFEFDKYDKRETNLKRGQVFLARSRVFQDDLRREINPYKFGKEKKYIYPFWHEYHIWQVGEQMGHGLRNKIMLEHGEENYGLIITPKTSFDIYSPIFFHEPVSVELIWHKLKNISSRDGRICMENFYFSFYDKNNNSLARVATKGFTKPRIWITLADKIEEGNKDVRKELCAKLLVQRKYLDKIGRKPPHNTKDLIASINEGIINRDTLENFFSMWDLKRT